MEQIIYHCTEEYDKIRKKLLKDLDYPSGHYSEENQKLKEEVIEALQNKKPIILKRKEEKDEEN